MGPGQPALPKSISAPLEFNRTVEKLLNKRSVRTSIPICSGWSALSAPESTSMISPRIGGSPRSCQYPEACPDSPKSNDFASWTRADPRWILAALSMRFQRYALTNARVAGIKIRKPTKSVSIPGVMSTAPASKIKTPSTIEEAGSLPWAISVWMRRSTPRPCRRARVEPRSAVRKISARVEIVPMRRPISINKYSSAIGTSRNSSNNRPTSRA